MIAVSIIGFSKSGKTTLAGLLATEFEARGLTVCIAKHTHQALDKPHTDTAKLMSTKRTVVGIGPDESMLFLGGRRYLADLLPLCNGDVLLVEGGKSLTWLPRVLCLRTPEEAAELGPDLALGSYGEHPLPNMPHFDKTTLSKLADRIIEKGCTLPGLDCGACVQGSCRALMGHIVKGEGVLQDCRAFPEHIHLRINGQPVGLNPFTANMLKGGIQGMLKALKGTSCGTVEITLTTD